MQMADHHDYLALDWVRGEIQETLSQAQQTLESYVENPEDSSRMRFCQTYLHQVLGTLKMVEFYGAALLAEEMEKLAEALLGKRVVNEADAQEILMRAILQLPPYLDRVQSSRRDLPVVLLPLLNDLRAVRGEALLTETALFKPDLSTVGKSSRVAPASQDANFQSLAHKLRQMYQLALLGLLRNDNSAQQLAYLTRVFSRLEQISGEAGLSPLWSVAAALVEGLREKGIDLSVSIKMMLGQIDRILRNLVREGAIGLEQAPPTELLKNLLYYVAKSTSLSSRIRDVRERFRLEDALPSEELIHEERARMSGPDRAAMSSVVVALSEELGKVKAALEQHIQEGNSDAGRLQIEINGLKQVADTLAVLGLGQPRDLVNEQMTVLLAMVNGKEEMATDRLMDVAGGLLYVESTLAGLASAGQSSPVLGQVPDHIAQAHDAVLRECHAGLEDAKEGIVEFIASQWDKQHLAEVPGQLQAVRGGLEVIQLVRPALILRQCVKFIEEKLIPESSGKPDWRSMDTLADAITGVEYYLERLTDDPSTRDDILRVARVSVANLGYPLSDKDFGKDSEVDTGAEKEAGPARTGVGFSLGETIELTSPEAPDVEPAEAVVEQAGSSSPLEETVASLDVEEVEDIDLMSIDAGDVTEEDVTEGVSENLASESEEGADRTEGQSRGQGDEDSLIDDEIIEIFVEEAGEVLEALNEYFPRWAANTEDKEALTEFRRAFHTLKGSGRMVGASTVGELAWSVENMMNRVIDRTIQPSQMLIQLVRHVHGLLPQLVEDFAQQRPASFDVQPLMDAANILAEGGTISVIPGVAGGSEETPIPAIDSTGSEEDESESLMDIFISEAETNLQELQDWLDSLDMDFDEHPLDDLVHRCLHTMKGSARMADVECIAELAEPAEKCVKEMINMAMQADRDMVDLLEQTHHVFAQALEKLRNNAGLLDHLDDAEPLIERYQTIRQQLGSDGERSVDSHLLNVFLSEGMDIILDAESLLERWAANPEDDTELASLRSELKLLAGSAETAGLKEVHVMAAMLASCYDRLASHERQIDDDFLTVARAGQESLVNMMDCLAAGQTLQAGLDILHRLQAWLDHAADDIEPAVSLPSTEGFTETLDDFEHAPSSTAVDDSLEFVATDPVGQTLQDEELGSIFLEEASEVLEQAQATLDDWHDSGSLERVAELQRYLHTLKGGARMAGVGHVGDLAHELEFLYEELAQGQRETSESLHELLVRCHDQLASMIDQLRAGEPVFAADELLHAINSERMGADRSEDAAALSVSEAVVPQDAVLENAFENTVETIVESTVEDIAQDNVQESVEEAFSTDVADTESGTVASEQSSSQPPLSTAPEDRDPELVGIFLEEAEEILEAASESLDSWLEAPDNLVEVQSLQRDLHTLKGGARMAEIPQLGNLAHELENLYEGLALGRLDPSPVLFDLLHRCHDELAAMVDAIKGNHALTEASDLITLIHGYMEDPEGLELPSAAGAAARDVTTTTVAPAAVEKGDKGGVQGSGFAFPEEVDLEILDIFLEEATELSQALEAALEGWRAAPEDKTSADDIKRVLHTLKGGARLAGLSQLGNTSHEAESFIEEGESNLDEAFFSRLVAFEDDINTQIEQIRKALKSRPTAPVVEAKAFQEPTAPAQMTVAEQTPAKKVQQRPAADRQNQQPQEMVRIGADVLEALVNLAGETSINRGRVEQGVNEFATHIAEMGNTVERLYAQLRRLDVETEAQIMSNYKQGVEIGQYGEEFDPLEMDQYSELHQITKQLSESASDLLDLKNTLIDGTRDTETLLLQQARINTELQEKLMRTRMVPFSRLVPRLRRIVRQVSGELSKQVEFDVVNPEGELDRTLMERIVAPLEHMLRNAVDHGVEAPDKRVAAGKQAQGNITLELGRDGGDVLLVLSDDGGGININAVRKKAVERGLINQDSQLSEQEIQQFIFNAGFSTAEKVTQVSGRGVGMDVVASDIKQMGGSVTIDSREGKGTRFIVRLPFTLAMNRALLVRTGEDIYAIPLTQVEGIVRISPYELEAYLGDNADDYVYAGQHYQLDYLGQYVHDVDKPPLEGVTSPLPVLLLHSHEHQVALVVDSLVGSREIVVKSVGPQLSTVAGISGATILGDGSVVIILDIHSLVRAAHLQRQAIIAGKLTPQPEVVQPESMEEVKGGLPLIMVTDDSVTVRKVTTRLLERHGFDVMTAKDGVDAVAKLEERRPDLMLLDIEMPRMDGFEVASHMRHDNRFKDVPIIMITSRTGEKHRERAFDIGVNSYLGKPFQEGELLATIRELLALEK
jgi:chemosensory pili system protein ChpA (sensor histidine kinase/response regulator)